MFGEGARAVRLVEENTEAVTATDGSEEESPDDLGDNVGGGPVMATDANGDTLTYTLGGPDMDMFTLRSDGQIEVSDGAKLNYEDSASHIVTITATDSSGAANDSATIEVTIHVTDLDERPVILEGGFSIDGSPGVDYAENGTGDVATYMAVGAEADGATLTLEGDDDSAFTLQGGVLSFRSSPDFENPTDMDMDNIYMVTVKGSGGTHTVTQNVVVEVTNVNELGMVSGEANPTTRRTAWLP